MNEKLLKLAKEAGFDSSLGEITIIHMNRHINVTNQVKKLIELVQANSAPDGWQIVPIDPTEEMIYAGRKAWPRYGYLNVISENIKSEYKAMLEAAPKPPIVETKLKMAIEALQAECGNRCNAEYNPCAAKQALEKIGE